MTEDWASRFRPNDEAEPEEKVEEEVVEVPIDEPAIVQPTIADVNEILISLKIIDQKISSLNERVKGVELMIANPPWLNDLKHMIANPPYLGDLNGNLQAVLRDNAAAIVGANNQFMGILARKMDEMEERLSSDDPSYTNILYSSPELFNEVTQRPIDEENTLSTEEEFLAKNKIAEMVEEEHPALFEDMKMADAREPRLSSEQREQIEIKLAFLKWQNKEIKWHEFVKIAGGVKSASTYKKLHQASNSE